MAPEPHEHEPHEEHEPHQHEVHEEHDVHAHEIHEEHEVHQHEVNEEHDIREHSVHEITMVPEVHEERAEIHVPEILVVGKADNGPRDPKENNSNTHGGEGKDGKDGKSGKESGSGKNVSVGRGDGKATISQTEANALIEIIKECFQAIAIGIVVTFGLGESIIETIMKDKLVHNLNERERVAVKEGRSADAKFIAELRDDIMDNKKISYSFPVEQIKTPPANNNTPQKPSKERSRNDANPH